MRLCRQKTSDITPAILANGCRLASKTFGCHHAVAEHAWNTDRGNICILSFTQSVGIDSGIWQHLSEIFLPDWISGNFGMEWVKPPYIQNVTKKPACRVSNKFGNSTLITLESLSNEDEVEEKFKGKAYSMIWVNELSKFKKRMTYDTLKLCFRMPHLKPEDHLFLADTNPDLDLGQRSWIYQLWYELLSAEDDELDPKYLPLKRSLKLIEFTIDDNLSLSQAKKDDLLSGFAHDEDLVAAYYYGKWVTASTDALFYKVFRSNLHVIGEIASPTNPEPLMMVPEPNCSRLGGGWDLGTTTNNAMALIENVMIKQGDKEVVAFKILDELVTINMDVQTEDFVEAVMKKRNFWEKLIGKEIQWVDWSDRSAWSFKTDQTNLLHHQAVYVASGGKIQFMGTPKPPGSVRQRIDLFRKLLFEGRIFINNDRCPATVQMCKSIKPGKSSLEPIQKGSIHKHIFDAITYYISMECSDELQRAMNDLNVKGRTEGGFRSVQL